MGRQRQFTKMPFILWREVIVLLPDLSARTPMPIGLVHCYKLIRLIDHLLMFDFMLQRLDLTLQLCLLFQVSPSATLK
jgi:hypothetical protein